MGPASEPSLSRTLSRVLDARDAVGAPQSDPGRTPAAVLVALRERPTLAGEGMPGSPGEPL
ncbi:MAG: hypothetical protein KGJ43_06980, partial [Acidobacteriota bacterium]|nr:hypothetical protein [Acidobacteriota bacterium]